MKLRKGNVLHPSVSHSVHRGGCLPQDMLGYTPPGRHAPLWADTLLADPPPRQMATAADGTHPTGMLVMN